MVDEDAAEEAAATSPSKPRPSLTERTMETLSRLPSSPSVKGRNASSFFETPASGSQSPSRPSSRGSRPGSSHGSGGQPEVRSSPGSASGLEESVSTFRSQAPTFSNPLSPIEGTPLRNRRSIQSFQTPPAKITLPPKQIRSSLYGIPPPSAVNISRARTPTSPDKATHESATPKPAPKTLAPRPPTKRPSVNGLLKKPSTSALKKPSSTTEPPRKGSLASRGSSVASYEGTSISSPSIASASTGTTADSTTEPGQAYKKTSAALREQIAKARAAKRAVAGPASGPGTVAEEPSTLVPNDSGFDFGIANDPFNQHRDDKSQAKILRTRLETARTSGRLNIAAMALREIPEEVLNMYNLESIGSGGGSWAESVDLSRFVAADNELEMISDAVFPDVDPREMAEDDEESQGNIFAGLETLDLHGNILVGLPMGLRRLALLTSLNLVCIHSLGKGGAVGGVAIADGWG